MSMQHRKWLCCYKLFNQTYVNRAGLNAIRNPINPKHVHAGVLTCCKCSSFAAPLWDAFLAAAHCCCAASNAATHLSRSSLPPFATLNFRARSGNFTCMHRTSGCWGHDSEVACKPPAAACTCTAAGLAGGHEFSKLIHIYPSSLMLT